MTKKKEKEQTSQAINISIWDVLQNPKFEENLKKEMELMDYTTKHTKELRVQVQQQYERDMQTLALAEEVSFKELLKDYSKPDDFTIKYVEVMTKKSKLSKHKRNLIEQFFAPIIKNTAIQMCNEAEDKKKQQEAN